jgi:hypothetical protein
MRNEECKEVLTQRHGDTKGLFSSFVPWCEVL